MSGGDVVVLLTLGTSAQVVAVPTMADGGAALADAAAEATHGGGGLEVRPTVMLPGATPATMLVGAAMNGGNVLAAIAGGVAGLLRGMGGTGSTELEAAYAALESGAAAVLATTPLMWEGGTPRLGSLAVDARLVPERGAGGGGGDGLCIRGVHQAGGLDLGGVYAAAAAAMLAGVARLLPAAVWRRVSHVRATGGALHRSATLRALLPAVLAHVSGRADLPLLQLDAAADTPFAGAIGAALAAFSCASSAPLKRND